VHSQPSIPGARVLEFTAYGRPAPQGSKSRGATGQMRESSEYLANWREAVRLAAARARIAQGWTLAEGPCQLDLIVYVKRPARPASHCELYPAGPPDLDKYARAVSDALTLAGVWRDDSRWVISGILKKWYAGQAGAPADPGAWIRVSEIPKGVLI